MKKMITTAALAVAVGLTGIAPAAAAPLSIPSAPVVAPASDIQNVDLRVRGGVYFYNGHRGSRRWRRGWRRHRGWYYPPAAFYQRRYRAAPRRHYRDGYPRAHYRWCHNRYRSYRSYDNTFQPYHGGRRQCYSPYS
ncbi:BA14K family protein [Notoacmeibacter sp. MSK16QG-6]|uniref:BA14K family protein n=1 Tax=Notoacmeibacter sp. MSK16QG-6 TaxID=2957982 RepID=UPI00209F7F8D|nr:BA14K family protein [Notoacmeibacter sp. MSK16QG-6]MCP1198520.1 BA14K family protein [Notoacmeibacter sp. MSK16QG-6]